jgi:hypothetical protein
MKGDDRMFHPYYRNEPMWSIANFNVTSLPGPTVADLVSVWVPADGSLRHAKVTVTIPTAPDDYTQVWSYDGEEARRDAINKALSHCGFGELERNSDDDN